MILITRQIKIIGYLSQIVSIYKKVTQNDDDIKQGKVLFKIAKNIHAEK